MSDSKQIVFIADRAPGMKAGTYTVNVNEHVVIDGGPTEDYAVRRALQVRGERFSVQASEIHAVFPPEKSSGPYLGCVPHVTFDRAMLPWLRALREGEEGGVEEAWLAVLLFDPDEMPAVTTLRVKDLAPSTVTLHAPTPNSTDSQGRLPSGYLSYPLAPSSSGTTWELEYGETPDDGLLAIDVPVGLFKAVAPALGDMRYLAHVRSVTLAQRAASAGRGASRDDDPDVGQFATVLGNRLPSVGDAHAVLVSLEGLGEYLPGGGHAGDLSNFSNVRLVVLKHWQFNTLPNNDAVLRHALEHLCDDPAKPGDLISHLRISAEIPTSEEVSAALAAEAAGAMSPAQADVMVRHGLAMGYVPLGHHMRTGGRDISWYRGPLLPLPVKSRLTLPLRSSDAGLAYNPTTGMFDVSYAAAWELGRLLSLGDRQFSSALYSWVLALKEQGAAQRDQLSQSLPALVNGAKAGGDSMAALFSRLFASMFAGPRAQRYARAAEDAPPPAVDQWLAGLKQLKNVPLHYLIPDGRMMPAESLRFFYLDVNWINALIDGACSIVHTASGDPISEARWLFGAGQGPISGYLLNSNVVIAWPGLSILAFHDDTPLKQIHDDTIAPGLRMALFDGDLNRLEIQQPGEGLHFGIDYDGTTYTVPLRQLTGQPGKPLTGHAGEDRRRAVRIDIHHARVAGGWSPRSRTDQAPPPTITVPAVMRDKEKRVMDVAATARSISQGLTEHGNPGDPFTSAEYGLEIAKSVIHVSYCLDH